MSRSPGLPLLPPLALLVLALLALAPPARPAAGQPLDPGLFAQLRWRLIGPFRGGRTVAAVGVPGQAGVYYVGVVNGGVWKTIDAGQVWRPIFDGQPTQSIGAIAIAPSDPRVIYVGSGEGLQRPDLSVGDGIYKSIDGGGSWTHLGLRDGQQIPALLVDPHDPNRVYAAVLGHPYGPNSERGVFRSTDGGASWEKVLYKDENTGAVDLAFDPADPRTIYADLWAARQAPWEVGASFNGPGSGLYKSADGGATWKQLTAGLPTVAEGLGRIGIGVAPSQPGRIYAQVDADSRHGGLYRSNDAGASWRRVNDEERIWGRGGDFAEVKVDPGNPDLVYVCNTSTYRSADGGQSFTAIKGAPGGDDYHRIWIDPERPQTLLLAGDQGAAVSLDGGQSWSSWYNQPTAQFYHVATDDRFPYWVYGGQQESGSAGVASRGNDGAITFRDWHPVGAEEYGYVAPDPLHANLIFGGKVHRFDWSTGDVQDVSPEAVHGGKIRYVRTLPLLFAPLEPEVLYFGASVLFKTGDGGHSWQIISPDLTRAKPAVPASLGIFTGADPQHGTHRGVIYTVAPSRLERGLLWTGTDDGLIHFTRDGGRTWLDVTPPALTPWSKVSLIEASHFDAATAYAAVNRFRLDDLRPHIYRTRDFGRSWQEISRGIGERDVVNAVREDPLRRGLLFAGTERGVYVSFDDGGEWQSLRLNLPATSVRDLVVHGDDLVVGTHGRSFWILDDISALRQMPEPGAATTAANFLFRPAAAYRVQRDRNTDTPLPPEEAAGENPPDGAVIDYRLGLATAGPVTIEILDSAGRLVRRFSSADAPEAVEARELLIPTYWIRPARLLSGTAGMHRFVWDLRYPPPDALRHDYRIAAIFGDTPREPLGPLVLPGEYQVSLKSGEYGASVPLTVKMDPRVKTPPAGLAQQLALATRIVEAMRQDAAAWREVKALRASLAALPGRAKPDQFAHLQKVIAALDAKAQELLEGGTEGGRRAAGTGGGGGGGRSAAGEMGLARLNDELSHLLEIVEGSDAAPTTQAEAGAADLERRVARLGERWSALRGHEVAELNRRLQAAGLAPLGPRPQESKP
ncbi:MAG TPA: glycoside hydrolase [Thermoanaerobaculia bacterium]|nr:glycoside hydrolase [Thermoanaerobaculia bacterium]